MAVASVLQQPDLGPLLSWPISRIVTTGQLEYKAKIPYIDADTGKSEVETIPVKIKPLIGCSIPEVPEPCRYFLNTRQQTKLIEKIHLPNGTTEWPSAVQKDKLREDDNVADHINADKFCRSLSWKLSDMRGTKASIVALADVYKRTVGSDTTC